MSVSVRIPPVLRAHVGGVKVVQMSGATLGEVLSALVVAHADLREQIFESDGALRRWVNVYVDGADARHLAGLETPTPAGIEVVILPAMAGGSR
ncbi:MAG: molybdopterin synthase sulfur carrier subunit [Chloroflexi bacterium]|nr:MAG: molybdopterin synthase sulfur carrier subunit [Chloroflexota bacterium]RLT29137.1 MAG: molybdopterin synthase sulfur carrier subunit [Chloroflexota bacterium]